MRTQRPSDVEVAYRRPGAPARATNAVWSVDKDDPARGTRAARTRKAKRQHARRDFEADAELAASGLCASPPLEPALRRQAERLLLDAGQDLLATGIATGRSREAVARAGMRLAYLDRAGRLNDEGRAAFDAVLALVDAMGARAYLDGMIAKDIARAARRLDQKQRRV